MSTHLTAAVGPAGPYNRTTDYRNPSTSPPQPGHAAAAAAAAAASSHSPLTFTTAVQPGATSPAVKRKQADANMNAQMGKRRRGENTEDAENAFDLDGSAQGAKHWTDVEKTKLFEWLMGPGQEEHWNALRATKNSCLREVSPCPKMVVIGSLLFLQVCHSGFWRKENLSGPQGLL